MEFGELRTLCQEPPGQAAWRALIATLDAKRALGGAHADEAEEVWVPYATQALEGWPVELRVATLAQLERIAAGERVLSMRLVRRLRWSGIWGKLDMDVIARCPDLVALSSLHLYQTEDPDLLKLVSARPELLAQVESLQLESPLFRARDGREHTPLELCVEAIAAGGRLRTLHIDGTNMARLLPTLTRHVDRLPLTALHMRDGALLTADDPAPLIAWLDAGGAAGLTALNILYTALGSAASPLLDACPHLTTLGLRAQDLPGADLMAALGRAPLDQLTSLEVGTVGLPTAQVAPLSDLLHTLPALRTLRLHEGKWSTERAYPPPLDALAPLPAWLTDVSVPYAIAPARVYVPGMRPAVLRLPNMRGEGATFAPWLDMLELSGLESLRLMNSLLGAERLEQLARLPLPALTHADLWGCALGDRGVEALIGASWSQQLRTLDLTSDQLTPACIPALSEWIKGAQVRQLSLDSNERTLPLSAVTPLAEAALTRSAPLLLSVQTQTAPNQVGRRAPPRPSGAPWPPHLQFAALTES